MLGGLGIRLGLKGYRKQMRPRRRRNLVYYLDYSGRVSIRAVVAGSGSQAARLMILQVVVHFDVCAIARRTEMAIQKLRQTNRRFK